MRTQLRLPASVSSCLIAVASVAAGTLALFLLRHWLDRPHASLLYLLVVVLTATTAGSGPAILAAVLAFLAWNFFLLEPVFTFHLSVPGDWMTLCVFLVIALVTGELAGRARQRAAEAEARLQEIERLSREAAAVTELRAADELKTALLGSVSHDLKTPLASILASLANLRERDRDPAALGAPPPGAPPHDAAWWAGPGRETLQAIEEEAQSLAALVSDLLDLSRLESGAWQPARDWYDLSELLGSALGRFPEPLAARVRTEIPDDLPMLRVDGVQIAQVLWNLIDNALKYSPPGAPVVVRAQRLEELSRISVSDQGAGIPPAERERIFHRFYRSAERPRAGVPGTGLGLAICRGLIEAHGGRIVVTAGEGGGGAVFVFTL